MLCTVQGILFSTADCVKTPMDLVRLWMHECDRVYRDKLVDEKDMENYDRIQADITKKIFEVCTLLRANIDKNKLQPDSQLEVLIEVVFLIILFLVSKVCLSHNFKLTLSNSEVQKFIDICFLCKFRQEKNAETKTPRNSEFSGNSISFLHLISCGK